MAGVVTEIPTVVRLRLPDGREFDCHSTVQGPYAEGHEWWWTDGNGSCDCNRSLYLNREHGLTLGEQEEDGEWCMPCGDTIELVSVTIGGVKVYGES